MDKVVGKIIVLREICENKSVLFGPFSEDITLQRKVDLWVQILNKAKALGLISYDKDYKYMRDVYWQNLKRGALGKKTSKTKKERKYSPIDDLVFEILEKSTAPVPPLPKATEQFSTKQEDQDSFDSALLDSTKHDEDNQNPNIVYLEAAEASPISKKRNRPNKTKYLNEDKIRKKKMALQVEFMELQNYKLKLEVLVMEQKLGVIPSKYTKEIAKKLNQDKNADSYYNQEDSEECESDDD